MFNTYFDPKLTKEAFYKELLVQVKALIHGESYWVTNLANVSSLIYHGMNGLDIFNGKVNWVGFYLKDKRDPNYLILGPFQGKVACTKIKIGKGVCGKAAEDKLTQVVPNVHDFPGHIACDSNSNSEIVVPLICKENDMIGVLDIDDEVTDAFDEEDKAGLENVVRILIDGCEWDA